MVCWFSGWAYVVRVPIWCVPISAISLYWSLFRSCFFFYICYFVCRFLLIFLSRFAVSASSTVFFQLLLSHAFSCIRLTSSGTPNTFSLNSFSCSFLLVIDATNFDRSNSLLNFGESVLFLVRSISPSGLPEFPCLFVSPKSNWWIVFVFFCKWHLLYSLISLSILILSGSVRYFDRVIWCVASSRSAQRKSCCIFSYFVFPSISLIVAWNSGPISISYFLFVFCLNRSNRCR